jgi:hypothetical protein
VAHELYGRGTPEALAWVSPLTFWRKHRWPELYPHAKPTTAMN